MHGSWLFRLTCLPEVIGYSLRISVVINTDYLVSIKSVFAVVELYAGKANDAEIV